MRSRLAIRMEAEQAQGIDLSPLLDVVFILLIFFIVTTVFVKNSGIDVEKPKASTSKSLERQAMILAISAEGQIFYDGANIGLAGITNSVKQHLRRNPSIVIVEADRSTPAELLVNVIDAAKLAGASSVKLATEFK